MLSANLSWGEFVATEHRDWDIVSQQMDPPTYVREAAQRHASEVWQPFRELVGPIRVSSGYRCVILNRLVSGSRTSAHMFGRATDNQPLRVSLMQAMTLLLASDIPYDKAIWEFNRWLHIQSPRVGEAPRREALMTFDALTYLPFNPEAPRIKEMTA